MIPQRPVTKRFGRVMEGIPGGEFAHSMLKAIERDNTNMKEEGRDQSKKKGSKFAIITKFRCLNNVCRPAESQP